MKTAPKPAPASGAACTTDSVFHYEFLHQGHRYSLFKRYQTPNAAWYLHFQHRGKRHKFSLETNVIKVAEDRARKLIDGVRNEKWEALNEVKEPPPSSNLAEAFTLYDRFALIGETAKHKNKLAVLSMIRRVHGAVADHPEKVSLELLDESLVHRYQEAFVQEYVTKANGDTEAQREARERALRTSRSFVQQARGLFSVQKDLPAKYAAAGLRLPECINGFMTVRLQGKLTKSEYHAPPDVVIEQAFKEVEKLRSTEPDLFLAFWLAVGAGLRRSEIQAVRWEHFVVRDGTTWISGGIGKDGEKIEVPVQAKAMQAIGNLRKPSGYVLAQRGFWWAKQLNWWMKINGWETEKKMHELRAYVGSLLYNVNPHFARLFMRHKSIKITEDFYAHYCRMSRPVNVL